MIETGNGIATSAVKSTTSPARKRSTKLAARARMRVSIARITCGAKPGCTSFRYRECSGGSVCIIVGGNG